MDIAPDNTIFIVLSFEGPDVYSMAGGLGTRITHLTSTLAAMNFQVHHIFIGAPRMDGLEVREDGRLVLHRWCQWISEYHPAGVYNGEEEKLYDFTQSVPPFVVHELATPAIREGKLVVILGEEWHTSETLCCISDLLHRSGLRDKVLLFWNANNTYGFERIDWQHLSGNTTITTVSKYMKNIMLKIGINPLVIPNGIPVVCLKEVDGKCVSRVRERLDADLILSKVARWHRDKGWKPAIDAISILKKSGRKPVLLARGSTDSYRINIAQRARLAGLTMKDIYLEGNPEQCYRRAIFQEDYAPYFEAISKGDARDILNLMFPIPRSFMQVIYQASDVVLANSTHEPFGLVGLEAMAAGAVVFTGCSGEDYANHMYNASVLDISSAEEIQFYIDYLSAHPEKREMISAAARRTAGQWTWEEIVKRLICKLEYQARVQRIVLPSRSAPSEPKLEA